MAELIRDEKTGKILKGMGRIDGARNKRTIMMEELHQKIIDHIDGHIGIDDLLSGVEYKDILAYLGRTMPKDLRIQDPDRKHPVAEELKSLRKQLKENK